MKIQGTNSVKKSFIQSLPLYSMILLPLIYIVVFNYFPMYGLSIAFKEYSPATGIFGSEWVGLKHFVRFLTNYDFLRILKNTLYISIYSILAGFVSSIVFALLLNYMQNKTLKKIVQTVSYAPNFISVVVIVGIILRMLDRTGIVNNVLTMFGMDRVDFMGKPEYFVHIFVWSGVWQSVGFGSIIYIGVLTSIDQQLYEAATIDGANVVHKMWYIDIPSIMPTAIILLILNVGSILNVSFEKILLMQNSQNLMVSEVISTYVYKVGLQSPFPEYSYSTAIGLVQSVVGVILMVCVNYTSRKVSDISMW